MKLIMRYMKKKDRLISVVIILFVIIEVFLETKIPVVMGEISSLLQSGSMSFSDVKNKGLEMIAYALLSFTASTVVCFFLVDMACRLSHILRVSIFEKILGFSLSEITSFGTGTLISRCNNDIDTVQGFVTQSFLNVVRAPILLIIVFYRLSSSNGVWTAMSFAAVALMVAFVFFMLVSIAPVVRLGSIIGDKMVAAIHEHIYGIRLIHLGNQFSSQENDYNKINKEAADFSIKIKRITSFFSPFTMMLIYGLTLAVYISGAFIIQHQELSKQTADFAAMVSYVSFITFLFNALVNIILVLLNVPSLLNSQNRLIEVLDQINTITDGPFDGVNDSKESVEFKNVSFTYPGSKADAISDINFKIYKGQTVAIIGGTGSGKTTVLNLLLRLYEAGKGEIFVDGIPIKEYKLKALRNLIGYVPQQNYLFSGTIADNIGYGENGRFKATLKEIEKAARTGQADSFIREKEKGYYEDVYAGGTNFSGGQRQRLTISRALCRDPEIYVFDDSFSALDFETDAKLRKALKITTDGATVIMVSQRIASVRDADLILVMDNGRIVGSGTHEQLLDSCSVYKEIAVSQNPKEMAV